VKRFLLSASTIVILSARVFASEPPAWKDIPADAAKELASENISEEIYSKLVKREVVVQKRVTPPDKTGVHVAGFGIVSANVDTTWEGMTECENLPKFMPSMVDCHPIKAERPLGPNERWTYNELKFSFGPISQAIKIIEECKQYPKKKYTWERVSGDTKVNIGSWRMITLNPDHQLLVYDTITDVAGVPDWIARSLTGKNLPTTVRAMRKWIEETLSKR
jgi:hypothetical protein